VLPLVPMWAGVHLASGDDPAVLSVHQTDIIVLAERLSTLQPGGFEDQDERSLGSIVDHSFWGLVTAWNEFGHSDPELGALATLSR
jgi:hypothetical protein